MASSGQFGKLSSRMEALQGSCPWAVPQRGAVLPAARVQACPGRALMTNLCLIRRSETWTGSPACVPCLWSAATRKESRMS